MMTPTPAPWVADPRLLPWMTDALCTQVGGELWFPKIGQNGTAAIRICNACPVQQTCLDYAMDNMILEGIFGGMSPRQRQKLRTAS